MRIYKNFNISDKFKNSAIAIGNFDGFHLGHQKVIRTGKSIAKKNKLKFGLLVFHPLPIMFFNKKLKNYRIDSLKQKIETSRKLKIDFLIIKKFDKNFSPNLFLFSEFMAASPDVSTLPSKLLSIFIFFKNSTTFFAGRGAFDKKTTLFELDSNSLTALIADSFNFMPSCITPHKSIIKASYSWKILERCCSFLIFIGNSSVLSLFFSYHTLAKF